MPPTHRPLHLQTENKWADLKIEAIDNGGTVCDSVNGWNANGNLVTIKCNDGCGLLTDVDSPSYHNNGGGSWHISNMSSKSGFICGADQQCVSFSWDLKTFGC